jgi:hypothetical protein
MEASCSTVRLFPVIARHKIVRKIIIMMTKIRVLSECISVSFIISQYLNVKGSSSASILLNHEWVNTKILRLCHWNFGLSSIFLFRKNIKGNYTHLENHTITLAGTNIYQTIVDADNGPCKRRFVWANVIKNWREMDLGQCVLRNITLGSK